MKKLLIALSILTVFSNTAFAAWKCAKVSTENAGDTLNVTMSCTDGVAGPVILTRPVFRPERKADVKNAMRNVAIEMRDRVIAVQKVSTVKANVDADNSFSANETDPTV